jgi:MFS family permease
MPRRLVLVIVANAMMRIAGGASGVLVGLYLADLANQGLAINAALVGLLAAMSFGAELAGAIPMGVVADAVAPHALMSTGALVAALAIAWFGLTRDMPVFFASRALEGLAAAAAVPPLLAHLVDETADDAALRARVMSYFELSLLAGLGVGGLVGSQLWRLLATRAFAAIALAYLCAAALLFAGAAGSRAHGARQAYAGLLRSLGEPALRRLAPVWLSMNVILGLWLGPTVYFLMTSRPANGQLLAGLLVDRPEQLGWLLLGYSVVFGTGLLAWSVVLPRVALRRALPISLVAMLAVSIGLLVLNHAGRMPLGARWLLTAGIAVLVMIESGFTPSALTLLASAVGARAGRGAAMGIYSFLLGIGALVGNLLAGVLGKQFAFDGLIAATALLALVALGLLPRLFPVEAPA